MLSSPFLLTVSHSPYILLLFFMSFHVWLHTVLPLQPQSFFMPQFLASVFCSSPFLSPHMTGSLRLTLQQFLLKAFLYSSAPTLISSILPLSVLFHSSSLPYPVVFLNMWPVIVSLSDVSAIISWPYHIIVYY